MSTRLAATTGAEHFGTISVAMVTPFAQDGSLDLDAGVALAGHLVDQGCDALILSGTTSESPVLSLNEKLELLKAVRSELGQRAKLVFGSSTYNTVESVEVSQAAEVAGADSLLTVTPYYSRPHQEGVYRHFRSIADAVSIPICLYDIPVRTGMPIAPETIMRLADHENVLAVKDAKADLISAMQLIENTDLAWYSGDDPLNYSWLALGATGFISVIGHVATPQLRELRTAFDEGDIAKARSIAVSLAPLYRAQGRLGGVGFAKAALKLLGRDVGVPRLPNVEATPEEIEQLAADLREAGIL